MRYAVLLALLAGCGVAPGQPTHHDGQDEVVALAWGMYGRVDQPPEVLWVEGDDLDCNGGGGFTWTAIGYSSGPACMGGLTLSPYAVSVAWLSPVASWPLLAHELLHASLLRRYHDPEGSWTHPSNLDDGGDSHHQRPEWTTLLPAAIAAVQHAE